MGEESIRSFLSLGEARELVNRFETCQIPKAEWDHRAHLAVVFWYLAHYTEIEATEKVINGIGRYNHAQAITITKFGGYHETITLFWVALTNHYLREHRDGDLLKRLNGFVQLYGRRKKLFLDYYSKEEIGSWRARRTWVEPDLRSLPE